MHQVSRILGKLSSVGAKVVLLATRDGLLIEPAPGQQPSRDLDSAAAAAASALETVSLMAGGLTPAGVRGVLVELEHGGVMTVHPIGDEMVLAVLADTIGGMGRLLVELRRFVPLLATALGVGDVRDWSDTAAISDADDPEEVEDAHALSPISPHDASTVSDEEKASAGSPPGPSQHITGSAVRASTAALGPIGRPVEAESASAPNSGGSTSPAQAERNLSSAHHLYPSSDRGRDSPQSTLHGSAIAQGADSREAATAMRSEEKVGMTLLSVHLDFTGQTATATVGVAFRERQATGKAVGRNQPARTLFLVAEAAAQAVTRLLPPQHGVMVDRVPAVSSGTAETWPVLVWLSPTAGEVRLETARVDDDSPEGMANAVVRAANECLGSLLAEY